MSLPLGDYYLRNIQRAQKSYLSAVKALAMIRKLALPVLQVNIARKQENRVDRMRRAGEALLSSSPDGRTGRLNQPERRE